VVLSCFCLLVSERRGVGALELVSTCLTDHVWYAPRRATPAAVARTPSSTHHTPFVSSVACRRHPHHIRHRAVGDRCFWPRPPVPRRPGAGGLRGCDRQRATRRDGRPHPYQWLAGPPPTPALSWGGGKRPLLSPRRSVLATVRRPSRGAAALRPTGVRQAEGLT